MANSKKGTAKADAQKTVKDSTTVKEIDVQKDASVQVEEDAAKEETKEENTSVASENNSIETSEAPRKKRKYTKKASSKTTDSKTSSKKSKNDSKAEKIQEVYIEFGNNNQIYSEEVIDRIQEAYKNEGHRISSIKKLQVYMNIDERKAYYVINDKGEGKYVDF